tara:strand:+ start:351 stop:587 length:237 start_codon:yes stop_codon:yes gene_type:complete
MNKKEMAKAISDLKKGLSYITLNTERLLDANKMIMKLEADVFHEKWKVRYLTRRLNAIDPNEMVSEEELDEQIKGKRN